LRRIRVEDVFMTRITAFLTVPLALASVAMAQKGGSPPPAPGGFIPCTQGNTANLCVPLDETFQVVPFAGQSGVSGPADQSDPCRRNDDDFTNVINLPFTFDLFGTPQTQVFINNNGNVSFGGGFSAFTSTGFPVAGFPMIAPFWADVDTRGSLSGVVWFRLEAHKLVVTWDHVGYYNIQTDKLNTFQLLISDGTDAGMGIGNNVCFCYGDMQWTTGSASGGIGGFGGTPATVGVNQGNGVDFFQIGRFDHEGTDYDGPTGNADGVSFLDGQNQCFNVGSATNTPPIFLNVPSGCLMGSVGVPLEFQISAIAPEAAQSTTITVDSGGLANFNCILTPGGPGGQATANCTFTPSNGQNGSFFVTYTACDNFSPSACSTVTVCLLVAECHQLLGRGAGGSQINLYGHLFDSQIGLIRAHWPVTMVDHPSLPVPNIATGQLTFSVETVMYNPVMFPLNPSQRSERLRVTVWPGQFVTGELLGSSNGMHIAITTYLDNNGHKRMSFPFTIDGM
jgi:hypothetical protein